MTKEEIFEYRKLLEKEYIDKDLEIETSLSYITIGALGFFLTINEKFISLKTAHSRFFLILSLLSLFASFALILYRKSRTSEYDIKLMRFIDNLEPDSDDDKKLSLLWDECHRELCRIRKLIYWSLGLGVFLQIIFLLINV